MKEGELIAAEVLRVMGQVRANQPANSCLDYHNGELRESTAFPEDMSSVPSSHIGQLTTACDSSSRRPDLIFWLPRALHVLTQN